MTWHREIVDIFDHANVQLINTVLPEGDWRAIFPKAEPHDYTVFLRAVAQYAAFCNEFDQDTYPPADGWTLDHFCKRELSTLFAHIAYETGDKSNWKTGLSLDQEEGCPGDDQCSYNEGRTPLGNLFEAVNGQKYYGRGHIHLRWNGKYGQFSKAFRDDLYNGKDFLLEEPARILKDPLMMYTSALWLYMTPHFPKPSAHDVITGKFRPNKTDLTYGASNDF